MVNNPLIRPAISLGGGGQRATSIPMIHCGWSHFLLDMPPKDLTVKSCGILPWANWSSTKRSSKVSLFCWGWLASWMMWWVLPTCSEWDGNIFTYDGWLRFIVIVGKLFHTVHRAYGDYVMWCCCVVVCVFVWAKGTVQKEKGGMKSTKETQAWKETGTRNTTIHPRLPSTLWGGIWTPKTCLNTLITKVFGKLGTLNLCHLLFILRFASGLSMGETCGLSPLPGLDHLNLAAAEAEVDRSWIVVET